jgi:hypothetical protein
MNPYITNGASIYMTDGAAEVLIETFHDCAIAEVVCKLLNDTYKDAYQDGMNASLHEKHRELVDKVTSLTIQNMMLKRAIE